MRGKELGYTLRFLSIYDAGDARGPTYVADRSRFRIMNQDRKDYRRV